MARLATHLVFVEMATLAITLLGCEPRYSTTAAEVAAEALKKCLNQRKPTGFTEAFRFSRSQDRQLAFSIGAKLSLERVCQVLSHDLPPKSTQKMLPVQHWIRSAFANVEG